MYDKYPLHINFDKMEDTYLGINNERFYGFKELICNTTGLTLLLYATSSVQDLPCWRCPDSRRCFLQRRLM